MNDRRPFWGPLAFQVRAIGLPWVRLGDLQAAPLPAAARPFITAKEPVYGVT